MKWQDAIFTIGSILFSLALLPMLFGKQKPNFSSAILTGSILAVFSATYATLALIFSAVTSSITAVLWLILAVQSYHLKSAKVMRSPTKEL